MLADVLCRRGSQHSLARVRVSVILKVVEFGSVAAPLKGFSVGDVNGVSFSELKRGLEDSLAASHAQYDAKVSFQIISKESI